MKAYGYNTGMINNGMHFAFVGAGGSGKSTIASAVKKEFPGLGLHDMVNDATRKRRKTEQEHSDYNHISEDEYWDKKHSKLYISTRERNGKDEDNNPEVQNYGIQVPQTNRTIFIVDPAGVRLLQEFSRKTGEKILTLFFDIEREKAYERMLKARGASIANDRDAEYEKFLEGKALANIIINANLLVERVQQDVYTILSNEIMRHAYSY